MESVQATIMFGSFECKLTQSVAPKATHMATLSHENPVKRVINPFTALEKSLQPYLEKRMFADVRKKSNGTFVLKHASAKKVQKLQKLEATRLKEISDFKMGSPSIVSSISIAGGHSASQMQDEPSMKRPLNTTPSRKRKISFKKVGMSGTQMMNFIRQLKNIMADKCGGVELVGKRTTKLKYSRTRLGVKCICELAHMKGSRKRVDLRLNGEHTEFVRQFARVHSWGNTVDSHMLQRGDSGVVLNSSVCRGKFGRNWDNLFIVRGEYEGKIFDARSKLTETTALRMIQY
nr:P1 protein [Wild potato mosaic virus]